MWWEKMQDPVLNQLIKEALTNNNQILIAQANILQAQAQLKEAHYAWLPTLSVTGSGFLGRGWDSHLTPQGALAQSSALSNIGNLKIHGNYRGFVPSYSLNILENINSDKYAKASLETQRATYLSTRLSIISQISGSYFTFLGQRQQLSDQTQLIRHLKRLHHLESVRFKDGASDLSTITSLDQQISNNQANLTSIENSISQVENTIQLLINHNPGSIMTHGTINKLSIHGLIPSSLPSAVLKNRPDILIAVERLKMADASIGTAYANFFPTISLTGLIGGSSVELVNLLKLSTGLGVAQTIASMPILNGVLSGA